LKVLGLDLSIASTGLAILDDDSRIFTKTIKTKPRDGPDFRLATICDEIENYLMADKTLRTAAIEAPFIHPKNRKGREVILGLHGAVTVLLVNNRVDIHRITPTELKKFTTGNGQASKETMIRAIEVQYGLVCEGDDIADAAALCFWLRETTEKGAAGA